MKVFFDHNMSPAMARALRELFKQEHEIATLAEKFRPDTPDVESIEELNREGRWVVFPAIAGSPEIVLNITHSSNLIGFFLASGLHKAPVIKQMERILALWPAILTVPSTVQGGAMYELPMKGTRLRQLKT